jgi:hypothetical protein
MARPTLFKHRKTIKAKRILRCSTAVVVGSLECIWAVAYESGDPLIGDAEAVEAIADWKGKRGKLFEALLNCGGDLPDGGAGPGFIEPVPGNPRAFQVHDLFDHCPDYVGRRSTCEIERRKVKKCAHCGRDYKSPRSTSVFCSDACRVKSHRETLSNAKNGDVTVTDTLDTLCNATPAPAPAPAPAPKEEIQTAAQSPRSSLFGSGETMPPADRRDALSPTVLEFDTSGTGAKSWALTQRQVDDWRLAFPGVDVLTECRKARAWIDANSARRKTAGGMRRFLVSWLGRAQNDAGRNGRNHSVTSTGRGFYRPGEYPEVYRPVRDLLTLDEMPGEKETGDIRPAVLNQSGGADAG